MRVLTLEETKIISGGGCWSDWSRCSEWSLAGNNKLWLECNLYCQCKGWAGGSCEWKLNDCWGTQLLYGNKDEQVHYCKCESEKAPWPPMQYCGHG